MRRHSAHVDANVLAELSAGLIGGRRAVRVHAHLAGCQRCARASADLSQISVLLASVPAPAMPDTVVRRLSAALADEAADRSGRSAVPARAAGQEVLQHGERGRGGGPQVPLRGRWRGLTSPVAARAVAGVAAACLVAAGGYTAVWLTHSPAGPGPRPYVRSPGGSASSARAGLNVPNVPPAFAFKVVQSGTNYRPAALRAQIEAELGKVSQMSPNAGPGHPGLSAPTTQQNACVREVTSDTSPALVDAARYQGGPATIIALSPVKNQISQAWVVGPRCSANNTDILAHVNLSASGG